jgi:cell division protein FtsI/penicillin-binding protein 2
MALVAAGVQHGAVVAPSLLAGTVAPATNRPPALTPATVATLRVFARAVVTEGTATLLAGLPGTVAGKTGTAEYGTASPPRSHAWFAGYRGDLAFAVFVEDGQSSHTTAVPVARAFLSAVP